MDTTENVSLVNHPETLNLAKTYLKGSMAMIGILQLTAGFRSYTRSELKKIAKSYVQSDDVTIDDVTISIAIMYMVWKGWLIKQDSQYSVIPTASRPTAVLRDDKESFIKEFGPDFRIFHRSRSKECNKRRAEKRRKEMSEKVVEKVVETTVPETYTSKKKQKLSGTIVNDIRKVTEMLMGIKGDKDGDAICLIKKVLSAACFGASPKEIDRCACDIVAYFRATYKNYESFRSVLAHAYKHNERKFRDIKRALLSFCPRLNKYKIIIDGIDMSDNKMLQVSVFDEKIVLKDA